MLKCVYALVGTDLFLQLDKLAELLRAAPKDIQRIDVDGETAELAGVLDELRSFSMFGSGKLLVVRNADTFVSRFREQLERYLDQEAAGGGTLVLRLGSLPANQRIHKVIKRVGEILDCNPPKDARSLVSWITDHAHRAHRVTLSLDAARLLADLVGGDLGRLDSELGKLALAAEGGRVDAKAIEGTVSFQREQQMWDMTDQIGAGQVAEALLRWRRLVQMDSSAEFRAVAWLAIWLEKVCKALALRRSGMAPPAIARELKIFRFDQQGPFLAMAESIGEEGVLRLLDLLAEVDFQSKSGVGDMAENVERFLLAVDAVRRKPPARRFAGAARR